MRSARGNGVPPGRVLFVVSGLPRSGTSLMMRILATSGLQPIAQERISYEDPRTAQMHEDNAWVLNLPARSALKVLYPQFDNVPQGPQYHIIWMHRDAKEQAKSQRAARLALGYATPRGWVAQVRKNIGRLNNSEPQTYAEWGFPVLRVNFDKLVTDPDYYKPRIQEFTGLQYADMACVQRRSPKFDRKRTFGTLERGQRR